MRSWNNSLSVGIRQLDQHNKLFYQRVCHLHKNSKKEVFETKCQFRDLLDSAVFHFACEEIWMNHTHFCFLAEHEEDHKKLCKSLNGTHNDFIIGNYSAAVGLSVFIKLLSVHIKSMDAAFGSYLADSLSDRSMTRLDKWQLAYSKAGCQLRSVHV